MYAISNRHVRTFIVSLIDLNSIHFFFEIDLLTIFSHSIRRMRIAMSAKSTNRQKTCVRIAVLLQIVRLLLDSVPITLGQTTCNNGIGRVLYERLPNQQLQGFDDDVVRDTEPPFRVLEKCQDLCLRDRMASNNLVRVCTSFDFQPGSRIASFSGSAEYEESTCYLTREEPAPEGIGILMLVPNSVHFTEVCLTCMLELFTFS